MRLLTNN
jgi:hypothetical protein